MTNFEYYFMTAALFGPIVLASIGYVGVCIADIFVKR